jgi:hypothetical protein
VTRLVKTTAEKFVDSKIVLKTANIAQVVRKADSLTQLLNLKTVSISISQLNLNDLNPAIKFTTIAPEINTRDKTMIAAII